MTMANIMCPALNCFTFSHRPEAITISRRCALELFILLVSVSTCGLFGKHVEL